MSIGIGHEISNQDSSLNQFMLDGQDDQLSTLSGDQEPVTGGNLVKVYLDMDKGMLIFNVGGQDRPAIYDQRLKSGEWYITLNLRFHGDEIRMLTTNPDNQSSKVFEPINIPDATKNMSHLPDDDSSLQN